MGEGWYWSHCDPSEAQTLKAPPVKMRAHGVRSDRNVDITEAVIDSSQHLRQRLIVRRHVKPARF